MDAISDQPLVQTARFKLGEVVRHRVFPFRGLIYDVDASFNQSEEWYLSIPAEIRPSKDQPFYHIFAQNDDGWYDAYVSEQNLLLDTSEEPLEHPEIASLFVALSDGTFALKSEHAH